MHGGKISHLEAQDLCENPICKQSGLLLGNFGICQCYNHLLLEAFFSSTS